MTECGQRGLQAAAIREGCLEEEEMSVPAGWVIMGVHLSGTFRPPTDLIVLLLILSRAESFPRFPLPAVPFPAAPCTISCWSPVCVPSLQLVSDTRRMSDIQWFREAYGAVTQTVRVVASEQSRQQRGWVFTPGELLTAFVPKARNTADHPTCRPGRLSPGSRSSALSLEGCGRASEGLEKGS